MRISVKDELFLAYAVFESGSAPDPCSSTSGQSPCREVATHRRRLSTRASGCSPVNRLGNSVDGWLVSFGSATALRSSVSQRAQQNRTALASERCPKKCGSFVLL
jgi:hypothetical protein